MAVLRDVDGRRGPDRRRDRNLRLGLADPDYGHGGRRVGRKALNDDPAGALLPGVSGKDARRWRKGGTLHSTPPIGEMLRPQPSSDHGSR